MGAVKGTLFEALILGVLAFIVALAANTLRASGSVKLTKNYFDIGFESVKEHKSQTASPGDPTVRSAAQAPQPDAPAAVVDAGPNTIEQNDDEHPDHPYQEVSFEEVVAIFNDPATRAGANTFVDARNDEAYEEGHIPGAIQADHYRLEEYIDLLLDYAEASEKLIVYCNGGDCEDSMFLCKDLLDFDVPYEKIYLYAGGWKEWVKKGMPVERGR